MARALILVGGSEKYHDLVGGGISFSHTIGRAGIDARLSQDFEALADGRLAEYDVVVFYTMRKRMAQAEKEGLVEAVRRGLGCVAVHASNVLDEEDSDPYAALVGSRFVRHPPLGPVEVTVTEEHPVTRGVSAFQIEDELYVTSWTERPGRVLATARLEGESMPIVYVKEVDRGRVVYLSLGHDERAWNHPEFQRLLAQGAMWAAGA